MFFPYIESYIRPQDPLLAELKSQLEVLHPKLKNIELYEGSKSYTLNKKRVYICLKDSFGRYYNRNLLVYVITHEYSHIICPSIGHTDEFFEIFHNLLNKATDLGLFNPSIPVSKDYCGHD